MSKTKYGEFEWDELSSVKWMRWKWVTKWMSWNLVHEMNRWSLVNEVNGMKITRQRCLFFKFNGSILLGDCYVEPTEQLMKRFSLVYNCWNIIRDKTCYKNPNESKCHDLMVLNIYDLEHGFTDFLHVYIPVQFWLLWTGSCISLQGLPIPWLFQKWRLF